MSDDGDRGVAQRGEDAGRIASPDSRAILVEGDVADIVDAVLDRPVAADEGGELLRRGEHARAAGDGVEDGCRRPAVARGGALDANDLGSASEAAGEPAGGDVANPIAAAFDATMRAVVLFVIGMARVEGCKAPDQLASEAGLVAFGDQQEVPPFSPTASQNRCWVCNASAVTIRPRRSLSPSRSIRCSAVSISPAVVSVSACAITAPVA